ncbi:MAG TPA: hypothetical protein VHE13_14150 [Opitutus sp.]|nr:hypothetical protein [Opitutus sp.]
MRRAALLLSLLVAVGCATRASRDYTPALARFFLEAPSGDGAAATLPVSGVRIAIAPKPVITEFDVVNVEVAQVELGKCLMFQLTPAAARDLYRLTGSNQGRRLVLAVDGEPVGARLIDRPLENGTIFTFVERPDAELPALVARLKRTSADLQREAAKKT